MTNASRIEEAIVPLQAISLRKLSQDVEDMPVLAVLQFGSLEEAEFFQKSVVTHLQEKRDEKIVEPAREDQGWNPELRLVFGR